MKRFLQAALAAASILGLAACASGGGVASTGSSAAPAHVPEHMVTDAEYVAYVERVARRRGVAVRWFHPPVRRVAASTAAEAERAPEPGTQ